MKPKIVPTSPKHEFEQRPREAQPLALVTLAMIILAILVSVGSVYGLFWLADRYPRAFLLRDIARGSGNDSIIVRQEVQKGVDQLRRVERIVAPSLMTLAKLQPNGQYSTDQFLGIATAITSDGWALALGRQPLDSEVAFMNAADVAEVTHQSGATLPLTLLQVSANTSPVSFVDSSSLDAGMDVWVTKYSGFDGGLHLLPATLVSLSARSTEASHGIEPSDELRRRYELDHVLDASWSGAAVVDINGRLIGLADPSSVSGHGVIPVNGVQRRLGEIAKNGSGTRASLGLEYFELSVTHSIATLPTKGAKVTSVANEKTKACGLKIGDVIVDIDGTPLTARRWLSDAVAEMTPGKIVKIGILRSTERVVLQCEVSPLAQAE